MKTRPTTGSFGALLAGFALSSALAFSAFAGVLDPDCTPEKAAKGAAAKATIGVGGRCKPAETVKDTTERAVGLDDDHKKRDKGLVEKSADKIKKD